MNAKNPTENLEEFNKELKNNAVQEEKENYTLQLETKWDHFNFNMTKKWLVDIEAFSLKDITGHVAFTSTLLFVTLICSWCLSSSILAFTSAVLFLITQIFCYIFNKFILRYKTTKNDYRDKYKVWVVPERLYDWSISIQVTYSCLLILYSVGTGVWNIGLWLHSLI